MKYTRKPTEVEKCKYCKRKGLYSFGWLDFKGEWHDKHLTCRQHAQISVLQQNLRCQLEQLGERMRHFNVRPVSLYGAGTP